MGRRCPGLPGPCGEPGAHGQRTCPHKGAVSLPEPLKGGMSCPCICPSAHPWAGHHGGQAAWAPEGEQGPARCHWHIPARPRKGVSEGGPPPQGLMLGGRWAGGSRRHGGGGGSAVCLGPASLRPITRACKWVWGCWVKTHASAFKGVCVCVSRRVHACMSLLQSMHLCVRVCECMFCLSILSPWKLLRASSLGPDARLMLG